MFYYIQQVCKEMEQRIKYFTQGLEILKNLQHVGAELEDLQKSYHKSTHYNVSYISLNCFTDDEYETKIDQLKESQKNLLQLLQTLNSH